jgi:hypothetical protein
LCPTSWNISLGVGNTVGPTTTPPDPSLQAAGGFKNTPLGILDFLHSVSAKVKVFMTHFFDVIR